MLFAEFERIRERPAIYGIHRIEDLEVFMTGLNAAGRIYSFSMRDDPDFLAYLDFKVWVSDYYQGKYSQNWVELIRLHSKSDKDTLLTFFQLLDEFKVARLTH